MSVAPTRASVRYFCYLLTSSDPKYKNHTYVGFTVNPKRRIRQHNGELTNGAKRTTRKRPWEMVVTVHGFPTKTLALQFEWILQHPRESKRFRDVATNLKKIGHLYFLKAKLRFLMEMLHIAPFHVLPLTVHWFTDKYKHLLADCPPLPAHIRANLGPLEDLATDEFIDSDEDKEVESNSDMYDSEINCDEEAREVISLRCYVCDTTIDSSLGAVARCVHVGCNMSAHLTCLSKDFLKNSSSLLPITGVCRGCNQQLHWGDVIKKMKGKALKRSTEDRHPLQSIDMNIPGKTSKKAPKTKKPATKNTRKKDDASEAPDVDIPSKLTSTAAPSTKPPKKATKKTTTTSAIPSTTKLTTSTTSNSANTTTTASTTRISATNFTNDASTTTPSLSSYSIPSKSANHSQTSSTPALFSTNPQPAKSKQKPKSNVGFSVGGWMSCSSDECEAIKLKSRSNTTNNKLKKPIVDDDCITLL